MKQHIFVSLAGLALVGGLFAMPGVGHATPTAPPSPQQPTPQPAPPPPTVDPAACTVQGQPLQLLDGAGGAVLFYSIACGNKDACKVVLGTQGIAQTCMFAAPPVEADPVPVPPAQP